MSFSPAWPMPHNWHVSTIGDKKWAYLNGDVGFGDFHHQILHQLGERQKMHPMEQGLIANLGLVNAHPGDLKHDIAWGDFHEGYPVFWRTNVDRNHIWDAVQYAKGIAEPSPTEPVTANLKEMAIIDHIRTSVAASDGRLEEIVPGGQYMDYDGQLQNLPQNPARSMTGKASQFYGANVVKSGQIIGSVELELETYGDGDTELVLHSAWVSPTYRGSDVWLQLYRWIRSNWPHDRVYGDFQNPDLKDFFERDNARWEDTAVGAGDPSVQEAPHQPAVYAGHPGLGCRAPWYVDRHGAVVVGRWGQIHRQLGLDDRTLLQGDVRRDGQVRVSSRRGPIAITCPTTEIELRDVERATFLHIRPHLRRAFGLAFTPSLEPIELLPEDRFGQEPSFPPEASQSPPKGFAAAMQGLRRLFGKSQLTPPTSSTTFRRREPGPAEPDFHQAARPRAVQN